VYDADTTWSDNGIIRNFGCSNHPWTCSFCNKSKKLGSLYECEQHCAAVGHRNALKWRYEHMVGTCSPDVPRWPGMWVDGPAHGRTCSMEEGSSNSGGSPSPADRTESTPQAAGPRELSSSASAGARVCTVILTDVTLNGEPIGSATLQLPISGSWAPPLDGPYVLDGVTITGSRRSANGSTAHASSPFPPHPQLRAGGLGVDDSSSSRPSVAGTGSAPGPNSGTFPGTVQVVFVASTQPPRPPPPRPTEGTHTGAPGRGAATARADVWLGSSRRLGDGEPDSSEPDSPREPADGLRQ